MGREGGRGVGEGGLGVGIGRAGRVEGEEVGFFEGCELDRGRVVGGGGSMCCLVGSRLIR